MRFNFYKQKRTKLVYFLSLCLFLFAVFLALDFLYPLDTAKLYRLQSKKVFASDGKVLRMALSDDGFWRYDTPSKEISPLLKQSVIAFEDRWFYYHFGINPFAVTRAFFHNLFSKKTIGASTITMQVARMMKRKKRSYKNKLVEMFNALQLEWHYSKDEILSFYLNLAPYGGNIEGVGAASYFYFKTSPQNLSIAQIALLTTIPKNPNINRPDMQKDLKKKRHRVLSLLYQKKLISKSSSLRAGIEPLPKKRHRSAFYAPHFSNLALAHQASKTALDFDKQLFLQQILKRASKQLQASHANNASAVLIDNSSMEVIAYVGSEDFNSPLGQNDGVRAIRSPGSTLKPFVYALALDEGYISPRQDIFDLPLYLGFYQPENFNKRFAGKISASEALQRSLNIPAIELNTWLGRNSLYELLKKSKLSSLRHEKSYYGHSLVLGGFGISLLDLTHLYTIFANDGRLKPLKLAGKLIDKNISLISEQSAYLVSEILSDGFRPYLSQFWESTADLPRIGFKTGTSADFKDLYTVGFSKDYTLGVWIGNFDGSKTDSLTGLNTSSKIVFDTFSYLDKAKKLTWLKKPKNIIKTKLCLDTIKAKKCAHFGEDELIKGIPKKTSCKALRGEVFLYLKRTKEINSIEDFSSHICYDKWKNKKPLFVSPYDGAELVLDKTKKIMLKCYSYNDDEIVYYELNGKIIQAHSGEGVFISLQNGAYSLKCLDSSSRASVNKIVIKDEI